MGMHCAIASAFFFPRYDFDHLVFDVEFILYITIVHSINIVNNEVGKERTTPGKQII